jgi:hypothetical protein
MPAFIDFLRKLASTVVVIEYLVMYHDDLFGTVEAADIQEYAARVAHYEDEFPPRANG